MIKSLLILSLLFQVSIYSQPNDSLAVHEDSLKIDLPGIEKIDSVAVGDSIRNKIVAPDTLNPIKEEPVSNVTNIINKRNFLFTNYRYTGDFLRLFQFNFIKDFAFLGYPNETFIYGAGFGGISYLEDGMLWNDRYSNSLNLNEVQSEDIDSVEILPAPRGFLFGPFNNPAAVNFIMRDFISPEPYSRIRYYEGPDGEAMIDGKFNSRIYKRWNLSFQVTNRTSDDRYLNTEYSMWQVNAKIKYFLSNRINITAIYQSVDSELGLNGGVDVESIASITNDINSELYDQQTLYVQYTKRVQKVLNHNFRLKTQLLPWNNAKADISFFYRYSENEINNDLDTVVQIDKYDNKCFGAVINFNQEYDIFSLKVYSNYEQNKTLQFAGYLLGNDISIDHNYFTVSSILSINLLNGNLIPSIFYKHSYQSYVRNLSISSISDLGKNRSGAGIDLQFTLFESLSLYSGFSVYKQIENQEAKIIEIGSKFRTTNLMIDLKYFWRENFIPYYLKSYMSLFEPGYELNSIKGFGVFFNYKLWKLLLETNASHYFDIDGYSLFTPPEIQFTGGIFLNDYFFEKNLLLKAGFKFYYTGKLSSFTEDNGTVQVDPSNKIDFTLAGEIKGVAIVYFIWENLANNRYFIVPYYPMPERNIRFGLSWELFN